MRIKTGCTCLLFILLSAWTVELKAGTFVVHSTSSETIFGQEVFPFSVRKAAEIRASIALPPQLPATLSATANLESMPLAFLFLEMHEQKPAVHSGAELRCIMRSLQP